MVVCEGHAHAPKLEYELQIINLSVNKKKVWIRRMGMVYMPTEMILHTPSCPQMREPCEVAVASWCLSYVMQRSVNLALCGMKYNLLE